MIEKIEITGKEPEGCGGCFATFILWVFVTYALVLICDLFF